MQRRYVREATTMMLYVAIVLLATLAALPAGSDHSGGAVHGPTGVELIAVLWGTTIGLAAAHWFAYHVAVQGFGAGNLHGRHLEEAIASMIGAVSVAAMASLPVLLFPPDVEQRIVSFLLAGIVGFVSYLVERANGHARTESLGFAAVTLVIGLAVALIKDALSVH